MERPRRRKTLEKDYRFINEEETTDTEVESEQEDVEEYEEVEPRQRRKRQKEKKKKEKGAIVSKKKIKLGGGRKKLRTGKIDLIRKIANPTKDFEKKLIKNEIEGSLFHVVRTSVEDEALEEAVKEWMDQYYARPEEAISILVTFIVRSAGAVGVTIDWETLCAENIQEAITNMIESFPPTNDDYPIISKQKPYKYFDRNFSFFWIYLTEQISESIIEDEIYRETFIPWLLNFSITELRPLRHSSTLVAFLMIDSLIQQVAAQKKDLEKAKKQQKSAKKKKNKSYQRRYQEESRQAQQRIENYSKEITHMFQQFFADHYKDVSADIRGLSVQGLSNWIIAASQEFFQDKYLKFLGWSLYDKSAPIREAVLQHLQKMYKNEKWKPKLMNLTKRYLPRYVNMVSDINIGVAAEACKLLTILLKENYMTGEEDDGQHIEDIFSLFFDENASLRYHAAQFLYEYEYNTQQQMEETSKKKRSKKNFKLELDHLIQFMNLFESEYVASFIVDNFWFLTDEFTNWDRITTYLLKRNIQTSRRSSASAEENTETANVIKLLTASIKKMHYVEKKQSLHPTTPHDVRINYPKRKASDPSFEESVENMTRDVVVVLPQLLAKYKTDEEFVKELLQIPQYFNLSVISGETLSTNFKSLLSILPEIFWKHDDPAIFETIAQTFKFLMQSSHSHHDAVAATWRQLVSEVNDKLNSAMTQYFDSHTNEYRYSLIIALERIRALLNVMDIDFPSLGANLNSLLETELTNFTIEIEGMRSLYACILLNIGWSISKVITEANESDAGIPVIGLNTHQIIQDFHQHILNNLPHIESAGSDLQDATLQTLGDLYVLLSPSLCDISTSDLLDVSDEQINKVMSIFMKLFRERVGERNDMNDDDEDEEEVVNSNLDIQRVISYIAKILIHNRNFASKIPDVLYLLHHENFTVNHSIRKLFNHLRVSHPRLELEVLQHAFQVYLKANKAKSEFEKYEEIANRFARGHVRDVLRAEEVIDGLIHWIFHPDVPIADVETAIIDRVHALYGIRRYLSRFFLPKLLNYKRMLIAFKHQHSHYDVVRVIEEVLSDVTEVIKKKQPKSSHDDHMTDEVDSPSSSNTFSSASADDHSQGGPAQRRSRSQSPIPSTQDIEAEMADPRPTKRRRLSIS